MPIEMSFVAMSWSIGFPVPGSCFTSGDDASVLADGVRVTGPGGWLPLSVDPVKRAELCLTVRAVRLRVRRDESDSARLYIDEVIDDVAAIGIEQFVQTGGLRQMPIVVEMTHVSLDARIRRRATTRPAISRKSSAPGG